MLSERSQPWRLGGWLIWNCVSGGFSAASGRAIWRKFCGRLRRNCGNWTPRAMGWKNTLRQSKNGIVISSIYGRGMSRIYAKPLEKAASRYQLSEEEKRAIAEALKK